MNVWEKKDPLKNRMKNIRVRTVFLNMGSPWFVRFLMILDYSVFSFRRQRIICLTIVFNCFIGIRDLDELGQGGQPVQEKSVQYPGKVHADTGINRPFRGASG
jgi:hypothetical protein